MSDVRPEGGLKRLHTFEFGGVTFKPGEQARFVLDERVGEIVSILEETDGTGRTEIVITLLNEGEVDDQPISSVLRIEKTDRKD
ncbi:hypothetical protein K2P56_01040 [Patescibacteria group bacterium]|nr:hypothetical protein [Patescibacteria group bacterium]